ncbi:tellurite resistance TerB family protein [Pseudomonas sp.]|uniref:tellurite resistance TerB family protein n=1 Tax=Pseudomonas sp. TaxID=306 RepID=UPI0028AB8A88|nr:tellurite resistance TerB family protein [Pseudomonas sp.]
MLAWLKTNAAKARESLTTEVAKHKNRKFMEAVSNASAMVALASNGAGPEEKQKMVAFLNNSPELKVFSLTDVLAVFNDAVAKLEFDQHIGQAEALKVIGRIKDNESAARLLVRVTCAIGASDGDFDEKERAACRQICMELGLNPADFEL